MAAKKWIYEVKYTDGEEYAYTAPHFFRDNYPGVTFAEGALDDMTYLVRPLR